MNNMNKRINLFGELQDFTVEKPTTGHYKKWRKQHGYQKQENPAGDSCKKCASLIRIGQHDKNYYKCALQGCSASEASDIRLSFVCAEFKK